MENKNRQKILLIGAAVCILLYLGNIFVYTPLNDSWKARADQIKELHKQLDHGTSMINNEERYLNRWAAMKNNSLPPEPSLAQGQLQKSFAKWEAASRGVTRVGYKPQWKNSDDPTYSTLDCRVEYTGTYDSILNFLYNLEKDPLGIRIDEVEISTRDEFGRQLSLNLQVSALRLNPDNATTTPAP